MTFALFLIEGEVDYEVFDFPSGLFRDFPMHKLRVLQIHNANFGNLSDYHFTGLSNLQVLSLGIKRFLQHFSTYKKSRNISLIYQFY